ncbi:thiamine-phosphate pyrophosphorylase [Nitratiruptor sp. YY08-26]|uniref:thiamine phosphate synthase n=1 Tax=unclassified Nitratiruptor TaxID=2624044 RepID=UPI0019166B3C|nr:MULTISPECIES: thiamine phosphate synthase [unclassified Nitratiruptor]BCD61914.1 thiamine-phosphate pyrophosphorylase [Nitratiruptor sp. YY08-13]BCD65849.1 thiamine-phosphate pyrophosphorylase [Nitratiruptor sp. YY08-26]
MKSDIYALCDVALLDQFGVGLEQYASLAAMYGCEIMQYRDKEGSFETKHENLKRLRKAWDGILLINDEIALARLCDGVHIGQEDLAKIVENFGAKTFAEAITILRKFIGAKIVGLSTHNEEEIAVANDLDLDYIGLGAYRASNTKDVSSVLGLKLSSLAKLSCHKVVAIGGIYLYEPIQDIWKRAVGRDFLIKALSYA